MKTNNKNKKQMWDRYCNFLNLNIEEYMDIQNSLMEEQIKLWSNCKLGKSIIHDKEVSLDNFRDVIPLTSYENYADILLRKDEASLCSKPEIWIQTTWEGGTKPIKLAPYSEKMLQVFRDNVLACLMLVTSSKKGHFTFKNDDKALYGLAPLPYLTGLLPKLLEGITDIKFIPPVNDALEMSFSQRNKDGFKQAMKSDIEMFFGLGSVVYAITKALNSSNDKFKLKSIFKYKPHMLWRLFKAKLKCKIFNRPLLPKDLFHLKAFVIAGTDNCYYKDELERLWGIRPIELFAGTEPSLIGIETWSKNGMYFFPNAGYYEFIKLEDTIKNKLDPNFEPKTYLMNEVEAGQKYELVISVLNGGAFMRYRCGDVYECIAIGCEEDRIMIPRFKYLDRIPWIIDVAGFTRFNCFEINDVLVKSGLPINDWMATKDVNENNKPYLHIYLEQNEAYSSEEAERKIEEVFLSVDEDYVGLKKILGENPLRVTILPSGTISKYREENPYFMQVNSMDHGLSKYTR